MSPLEQAQRPIGDAYVTHAARVLADLVRAMPRPVRSQMVRAYAEAGDAFHTALSVLIAELDVEEDRVFADAQRG